VGTELYFRLLVRLKCTRLQEHTGFLEIFAFFSSLCMVTLHSCHGSVWAKSAQIFHTLNPPPPAPCESFCVCKKQLHVIDRKRLYEYYSATTMESSTCMCWVITLCWRVIHIENRLFLNLKKKKNFFLFFIKKKILF